VIRRCDVAVVGGGLVGATLAQALRRWPLSIAVIDPVAGGTGGVGVGAGASASAGARSLALSFGSARLYRTLGLWDEVARDAVAITQVHVSRRGCFGFTRIRAAECGVGALGHVTSAGLLERRLNEALDSSPDPGPDPGPGPELRPGRIERIRAAVEAVEVRGEEALVAAAGSDGPVTVAARLVVGADGADSMVRRAAGLPIRVHRCDHVAIAGDLVPERPHGGRAFERFTECGPLAVLPRGEERCGFVWAVPESLAAAPDFEGPRFGAHLAEMFGGRLGELRRVERRVCHPLRISHAPRVSAPRIVLVGNAANALHPVGAQGFNLGLRDVEVLARLLGGASAAGADPASVAARYAAARRADHALARLLTGSLLGIYGSRAPLATALGAAGLFALDRLGPVKRGFANFTMGAGWRWGEGADAALGGAMRGRWPAWEGQGSRARRAI